MADGYISQITLPNNTTYNLRDDNAVQKTGDTMTGGLEIKGHIAGNSGSTGHGLYSGGGYHNAYNNIILHGDASTGTSGIAFISDKGETSINQPSDRAFIQWHAHGVTTYSTEGNNPTLATSGESNILMIGVGNDATDQIRLQTPGRTGLLHQVGNTGYVIPDTNNTTGSVGGTTTPVYVDGGIIKAGTALEESAYHADSYFVKAVTSTDNAIVRFNGTEGQVQKSTATINDNGGLTVNSTLAYDNSQLAINNTTSIAAGKFGWAISAISTMAATSNSLILVGAARSTKNQAYLGFHYEGSGSDSNYLTLGFYGVDHLMKIFPTGQTNITKNIASTSTTTGSLVVAGGIGIGERLTAQEINATRTMVVSAGKVYSNISGSNVQLPAKTSMLFANGIAFAHSNLSPANDVGWLRILGSSESDMAFEIATGDDGGTSTGEKIVVRQYTTSNTVAKEAILLEKQTGATSFPTSMSVPIYYGAEGNTHIRLTKSGLVTTSTTQVGSEDTLTTSTADSEWLKCLLREICITYPGESGLFKGFMTPNSSGYFEVYIYNTSVVDDTTGLPQYSYGTFTKYSTRHYIFGTSSYTAFCYSFVKNDSGTYGINITGNATNVTGIVAIDHGGTGATDAAGARINLGLGTIATQADTAYMKFGGDDTGLGSGSPAATAKTYWADATKVSDNMITGYYNHSGTEYSLLFSKRSTYGSILKWGYNDRYLRILRIQGGSWKSNDWEKIDAGYADTAPWSGISSKPTTISGYGITDAKIASGIITLGSNTITPITSIAELTGSTITATDLRTNLGLSAALRFIGKATTDMSESTTTAPTVTGVTNYVPEIGDVVLDKNSDAEYVCIAKTTANNTTTYTWELLGRSGSWATSTHTHGNITNGGLLGTASMAVVTDGNKKITTADLSVNDSNASTNATTTFVQAVTQNAQGKITVTKASLDTSGNWDGNAATATAIQTAGTTAQFYRGDNSWSNTIKQTANTTLEIDSNLKIGTARKDLNFDIGNGSGTGINDGYAGGITWGNSTSAYAGIYYQSSGSYGSRLIFGTTSSYANGAYARMIITHDGKVGIGTLSPSYKLSVNGDVSATNFRGALIGNADTATEFSSNATVTLTGDTTGTSEGSTKSWTITTTTTKLSQTTLAENSALSSFIDSTALIYMAAPDSNTFTGKPTSVNAFGCIAFKAAAGWYAQILVSSDTATGLFWRTATTLKSDGTDWKKLLDSSNYKSYAWARPSTITTGKVILSSGTDGSTELRTITNNTSNTAITNNTNIPTMNTIYYGLVTVNNASQTRATGIYAPTSAGTAGNVLVSAGGTSAPSWYSGASLTGTAAANWTASFSGTTDSSSTTSGAVKIAGGLGVEKQITALRLAANGSNTSYSLYINGTSNLKGATTIDGDLSFTHTGVSTPGYITWSSGSYLQRIFVQDDATANTAVFTFQQNANTGTTYTNLFTILDNKSVATDRYNYTVSDVIKAYTEYNSTDDSIDFIFA